MLTPGKTTPIELTLKSISAVTITRTLSWVRDFTLRSSSTPAEVLATPEWSDQSRQTEIGRAHV